MEQLRRLEYDFFHGPCLEVSRDLVGKFIVCRTSEGEKRLRITETEAYCGQEDTACHASRGRTARTEAMYGAPGTLYVYLCYGIHWMLNVVTGQEGMPQAALIRACESAPGPGRLTRALEITGRLNKRSLLDSQEIWIGDDGNRYQILKDRRVGIQYASTEDQERLWRFRMGRILAE